MHVPTCHGTCHANGATKGHVTRHATPRHRLPHRHHAILLPMTPNPPVNCFTLSAAMWHHFASAHLSLRARGLTNGLLTVHGSRQYHRVHGSTFSFPFPNLQHLAKCFNRDHHPPPPKTPTKTATNCAVLNESSSKLQRMFI